jgi:hypothetical protein
MGNSLGKYIDKSDPKGLFACSRIYMEVYIDKGLLEAISLSLIVGHTCKFWITTRGISNIESILNMVILDKLDPKGYLCAQIRV